MVDYKDHRKKRPRVKKKHLTIFYLFSLAVMLLVTPLLVLQVQQRTQTQSRAATACSNFSINTCPLDRCAKGINSNRTAVCKDKVAIPQSCSSYGTPSSCPTDRCTWLGGQGGNCVAKQVGQVQSDAQIHGKVSCDSGHGTCYIRSRMSNTIVSHWHTGKCPGSSAVQCYSDRPTTSVNPPASQSRPVQQQPPAPPASTDSQHIGKACSTPQGGGTCQFSNGCSGGTRIPGHCPGSSAVQCCVRPAGGPPTQQIPPAQQQAPVAKTNPNASDYCSAVGQKTCNGTDSVFSGQGNSCGITRVCCRPSDSAKPGGCEPLTNSTSNNPNPASQPPGANNAIPNAQNLEQQIRAQVALQLKLQGIGNDGNGNPQTKVITISLRLYKDNVTSRSIAASPNVLAAASSVVKGQLSYDSASGNFTNTSFDLGTVPAGNYRIIAQAEKYLDTKLTNSATGTDVFNIQPGQIASSSVAEMRGGDVAPLPRGNNSVDLFDYNAVWSCLPGNPPGACLNKKFADINDDGVIDKMDLDIVISNYGEDGFAFDTGEFTCQSDPSCTASGKKNSLQLCRLICTKKSDRL